ncbi:PASTA domain-containing protein [Micromonospora sp. NPDC006431]|uniref:PASTA domain-containing protein n=1 Tax=Micromonospora sp. NPDC006431 TaxID=3364235 RepID=UPI0036A92799
MSDDRQEPPAGNDDATRPLPPDRSGGADATARQEPVAAAPAWSGRAGVPPPRPAGYPEPGTEWYAEEQSGRRWWMPILLGILALVLIALIGLGVWLALTAAERNSGPPPVPSATSSSAPETSAAPTTTAPSTSPPTTPPTTAPARVPVPPLVGLPEDAARAVLDRLNVDYRVVRRPSDRPAGTVIETDPAAGELVSADDQVTVVVARAGAPTTATATPTPGPTATPTP